MHVGTIKAALQPGTLERRERWLFRAMIAPGLVVSIAVIFLPVLYAINLSFYQADSFIAPFKFVGLANYANILTDSRYWTAFAHGAFYAVTTVTLQIVLGIAVATVLNQEFPGRNALRGIALLPYVLPTVSAAFIWRWILDPNSGLVASILTGFGLGVVDWFGATTTAWISIIFISVWQWTPFVIVTYLAGLQGVPAELYESARLDGATAWQCFFRITLPMLKPILVVILLLRGIFMFNKFDMIWLLTGGGPLNITENLPVLAYDKTFNTFDIGGGAATACSIFVVLTLLIWVVFRVVRIEDET
jgi:multiple sugar transport system permease protein